MEPSKALTCEHHTSLCHRKIGETAPTQAGSPSRWESTVRERWPAEGFIVLAAARRMSSNS
eukprot:2607980-Pyramimonas_sp.AAC.1